MGKNLRQSAVTASRVSKYVAGFLAIALMVFGMASAAAAVNVSGTNLQFTNTIKIGADAPVGYSVRYNNVATGVDALLSVTNITNLRLNNVDRVSTTDNWQLWTNETIGSGGGSATYHIEFVATGTNNPVTLENMAINVGDIDARQYVQFAGVQSYTLSQNTALVATPGPATGIPAGSYRFSEPNGTGSTDTDTRFWAQVNYNALSAVDVTLGAAAGGSALFQVAFGAASWSGTNTAPVTPPNTNFNVTYQFNHTGDTQAGTMPSATTGALGAAQIVAASGVPTLTVGGNAAALIGWNTAPDGSGVMYHANDSIIPTADVVLYAIWALPATVTYFANNGAATGSAPAAVTLTGSGAYSIEAPGVLAVPGYKFTGWNTAANGGGAPYQPGESLWVEANTDFYAQWELIPVVPGGVELDVVPGDLIGGADVPYNVPGLEPGSEWQLNVIPTDPSVPTENIDAGTVDGSGTVYGNAEIPENLPPGNYELTFNGTGQDGVAMDITLHFTVNADGTLGSKTAATRTSHVLANTGMHVDALAWGSVVAVVLGLAFVVRRRNRLA